MKYDLVGINGNALSIMSYVIQAMKECGFSDVERNAFFKEATKGSYDSLVYLSVEMINKCNHIADQQLLAKL